jgi:methanogenic corrinoid protein MtbC1
MKSGRARNANFRGLVDEITTATRFGNDVELQRVVRAAAENIPTARDLVDNVLAPAARAIGVLWEAAVIDLTAAGRAVNVLGNALPEGSRVRTHPARHRAAVAFVCPVGEWHELPARMAAAVLRDEGDWAITTLGPSVSTEAITAYIAEQRPLAVLVSCTVAANLARAADMVSVVQGTGTPVIAGGAAFEGHAHRARAIGADMWCGSTRDLESTLHAWERTPPTVTRRIAPVNGDALTEDHRARIVDSAMRAMTRPDATSGAHPVLTERTAIRLKRLLTLLEAAVLVNDESILTDGLTWWRRRMRALQVSADAFLDAALDALSAALEPGPFRSVLLRARFDTLSSYAEG